MARKRRKNADADLAEALSPDEITAEARMESAHATIRLLRRDLHVTKRELGQALEVTDELTDAARAMRPPPRWRMKAGRRKPTVEALVLYGDTQIGEVTDPKQTEGWGRYNYAIAQARTARYIDCLGRWLGVQRAGYRIDRCNVVLLGDMISGDIHEELMRTNEFPPPQQAIAAARLVASLVHALSAQFKDVAVYGVSGSNHSRLTKRYQFKGGTLNSFDYVCYAHAGALLARHGNVRIETLPAKKQTVQIAGHWFLCGHGDHVKAWMGIPWYGIERDLGRESRRRLDRLMEQLRREMPVEGMMDYGLGGHWHTPFVGPSFKYLINGSLTGTNEFDHSAGRHAAPQQVAALVSAKHGMFGPVAWRLDSADEVALETDTSSLWTGGDHATER